MQMVEDVFCPRSFPENTYIERYINNQSLESKFQRNLLMKGTLVFVVGPSKSGKTVLCHNVISADDYIEISGSQILQKGDFWKQIAEKLPLANEVSLAAGSINNAETGITGSAKLVPLVDVGLDYSIKQAQNNTHQVVTTRTLTEKQLLNYLIANKKVLVIDDFHYIAKNVQLYIARTLKVELFNGLKAVIISLPHRSDEAIVMNPDLTGRTSIIEIPAWTESELKKIAERGFALLKIAVTEPQKQLLARESITSPQLMQDTCFRLAYKVIEEKASLDDFLVETVLRETASDYHHYKKIEEAILAGPARGKSKRKEYVLTTGTKDIYGLVLDALKADPPVTFIHLDALQERVHKLLVDNSNISSLTLMNTIKHINEIVARLLPEMDILEYADKTWYILDPFLLFYLRWHKA